MVILFDVGNTAVTYGIYGGGRLHSSGSFRINDIPKYVNKFAKSGELSSNYAVISSVVPNITHSLKLAFKHHRLKKILVAGENLLIPIRHHYSNIRKLGIDRQVNIFGAVKMYKPPVIIFDFGTAITVDYVSRKGVFEGGMIIPGPELAFQALIHKAALISKKIRLPRKRRKFLGNSTSDCISSGIMEGYGSMAEELIRRFKKRFGSQVRVIATGGYSCHLKPYTRGFDILDPLHSIKSLLLLFKSSGVSS